MEGSGIKWMRPLTLREEHLYQRGGNMFVCRQLSLRTSSPLREEQVRLALSYLYKKTPCLRISFGIRDGATWMRETDTENIDFEVVESGTDEDQVRDVMYSFPFKPDTGPLWCAKLLPADATGPATSTTSFMFDTNALSNHPYCYHLFLSLHHCTGDGTTAAIICGTLLRLLDDVMAQNSIDVEDQIFECGPHEQQEKQLKECMQLINSSPLSSEAAARQSQEACQKTSFVADIMKVPDHTEKKTRFIINTWDPETTGRFLRKCKEEGVTVNSGFAALGDKALVQFMAENGILQDKYIISNRHTVNLRRFWRSDDSSSSVQGNHFAYVMSVTEMPREVTRDQFWDYARTVHHALKREINEENVIRNVAKILTHKESLTFDMGYNNVGDTTHVLSTAENHVVLTHFVRATPLHHFKRSWVHNIHTFKGRLTHVLTYNTGYVSAEGAARLCQHIRDCLKQVL